MRVVEHGLVGKYVQCPTCKTIFEFQHSDELRQENGLYHSLTTKFYISCQECKNNIVVIERKLIHGPARGQWHTEIKQLNFVSPPLNKNLLLCKGAHNEYTT